MAKDFEKDQLFSITTERPLGRYPSTEDIDHLSYLNKSRSIFEDEGDDNMKEWGLVCGLLRPAC